MSAEKLREAAKVLRERAETEAVLRDGDPYYATEASAFDRTMHPGVGLALADWLEIEASRNPERPVEGMDGVMVGGPLLQALAVADAILGGAA